MMRKLDNPLNQTMDLSDDSFQLDDSTLAPSAADALLRDGAISVLVFSHDAELANVVRAAAGPQVAARVVNEWHELLNLIAADQARIILLDVDTLNTPVDEALAELKDRAAWLVVVIAARQSQAQDFMRFWSERKIHRLLIKPAAAGITRLLIESAISRYLELSELDAVEREHGETRPVPAPEPTRWSLDFVDRRFLLIAAGAVAALVIAVAVLPRLLSTDDGDAGAPVSQTGSPGANDGAVAQALGDGTASDSNTDIAAVSTAVSDAFAAQLAAAEAALEAGRLAEPFGESALDYYAAILAIAPSHEDAASGLAKVVDGLYSAAEAAIVDGDWSTAEYLLDRIDDTVPAGSRLRFLQQQLQRSTTLGAVANPGSNGGIAIDPGALAEPPGQLAAASDAVATGPGGAADLSAELVELPTQPIVDADTEGAVSAGAEMSGLDATSEPSGVASADSEASLVPGPELAGAMTSEGDALMETSNQAAADAPDSPVARQPPSAEPEAQIETTPAAAESTDSPVAGQPPSPAPEAQIETTPAAAESTDSPVAGESPSGESEPQIEPVEAVADSTDASVPGEPTTSVNGEPAELAAGAVDADGPSEAATPVEPPVEPPPSPEFVSALDSADTRITEGFLLEPSGNSARDFLQRAAAIEPDSPAVVDLTKRLSDALTSSARMLIAADALPAAGELLAAAEELDVSPRVVTALTADLARARAAQAEREIDRLITAFGERVSRGWLVSPESESALAAIVELRQRAPSHQVLGTLEEIFVAEAHAEARLSLSEANWPAVESLLDALANFSDQQSMTAALRSDYTIARRREDYLTMPVPVSELVQIRSVAPTYPRAARADGITGWVDVEFVVDVDGHPRQIEIVAAEPVGRFEDSALTAAEGYRFEPFELDGIVYERRTHVRIRYQLD